MMQESCKVGWPRLELLNTVKAVTLAICLKNNQYKQFVILFSHKVRFVTIKNILYLSAEFSDIMNDTDVNIAVW